MKMRVRFHGRQATAIGIMYEIPHTWIGEGSTQEECTADAARKAYADGWDHLHPLSVEELKYNAD